MMAEKKRSYYIKRKDALSMEEVVDEFIKSMKLASGLNTQRIFAAWDRMTVGSIVLGSCTSHHTFRDGVLTCRLRSSVVRSHLQFQVEALRLRLNAELEGEYVKQLKLM